VDPAPLRRASNTEFTLFNDPAWLKNSDAARGDKLHNFGSVDAVNPFRHLVIRIISAISAPTAWQRSTMEIAE
jgi:hypothetical protein